MRRPAARRVAFALGLLAMPAMARGQAGEVSELSFPPLPEFQVPAPRREVLANGMVVLLLEDHELPLVEAVAMVRTGSRLEPAAKVGLASLTGEVLRTGGTEAMDPDTLDLYLEGRAAAIESSIGTASGRVSMGCLREDFPEVLGVFADVLRRPAFDAGRLAVAKTEMVAAISRQNDHPLRILFRELRELVYGEASPYARTETYATVAAIGREDLVAWHRRDYHPERTVLGLVGDFEGAAALGLVEELFGDWPRGPETEAGAVAVGEGAGPGVHYASKEDTTQAAIAMGHLGITKDHPDFYAVEVMNQVLSGSFASRLFVNVRSKQGLAYAVSGGVGSAWDHPGLARLFLTTRVEAAREGIAALLAEARGMSERPPGPEEVARAKEGILNSFVFNSDSTSEILDQQLTFEYFGYPLDWLERYRAGIEAVTVEDVRRAAERHLHPERFAVLVVGPAAARQGLEGFGTIRERDISIPDKEAPAEPLPVGAGRRGWRHDRSSR